MTTGLGLSAYIDVPGYQRAPHNQEIASMLGMNTTLGGSSSQPAGTTSLLVTSSTGFATGLAWILDGPSSEVVTITGSADGTHVTLAGSGTAFAHAAGVSISQAGSAGSLAEVILRASSWIENYCQQGASGGDRSLWALTRTERWAMPSMRAQIDRDNTITIMPGHFPVQSLSAISIEFGQQQTLSLDATQLELQVTGRLIELPYMLLGGPTVGQQLMLETKGLSRSQRQWAVVTYVGGIVYTNTASIPFDIQQAAIFITSELLSQRLNPAGSAEFDLGKSRTIQRQRGDLVGDSILMLRAHDLLDYYRAESWA